MSVQRRRRDRNGLLPSHGEVVDLLRGEEREPALRAGALAGMALLTGSYLAVLYRVTDVVGGLSLFVPLVVGAVALAIVFGGILTRRQALTVAAGLLAAGLGGYLLAVPSSHLVALSPGRVLGDIVALLTGFSVFQMTRADVWALAVIPGPTFLTCYFALRGEYVRGITVGALTLGFFVLTGDSGTVGTLLGVIGATGAVGFDVLARHGGTRDQVETLTVAFAAMILASATITAVPGGGAEPVLTASPGSDDSGLVSADERARIGGSTRLTPEVQFAVRADSGEYWRTAAYDRFTGDSWVRTGSTRPVEGSLDPPPGPRKTVEQRVTAVNALDVLPAAADPYRVEDVDARVSIQGTLTPAETIRANESYRVTSRVSNATPEELREAGTDYPADVESRYLQVPESTPERVSELGDSLTADADNPYDAADRVETWLEGNKSYSTTVDRPDEHLVDTFLFEMDRGYCVYYATAMVTLLRTQGIPARYVVGYTPGQQVAEDRWVVREYDSHAWVEAYFPEYGWIRFDPTPAGPRTAAEESRLEEARTANETGVDAAGSERGTWTPTTTVPPTDDDDDAPVDSGDVPPRTRPGGPAGPPTVGSYNGTFTLATVSNGTTNASADARTSAPPGERGPQVPPLRTLALWSVLAVGLAAGTRRSGLAERTYREIWVRWQPAADPRTDVKGAYERVEYVLGRRRRPRRDGETVREYLRAVNAGSDVERLGRLYERALYAGAADEEMAAEARRLAAGYLGERVALATVFNRSVP